jgi:hypothetical protein
LNFRAESRGWLNGGNLQKKRAHQDIRKDLALTQRRAFNALAGALTRSYPWSFAGLAIVEQAPPINKGSLLDRAVDSLSPT